jgi:hypothetical protein
VLCASTLNKKGTLLCASTLSKEALSKEGTLLSVCRLPNQLTNRISPNQSKQPFCTDAYWQIQTIAKQSKGHARFAMEHRPQTAASQIANRYTLPSREPSAVPLAKQQQQVSPAVHRYEQRLRSIDTSKLPSNCATTTATATAAATQLTLIDRWPCRRPSGAANAVAQPLLYFRRPFAPPFARSLQQTTRASHCIGSPASHQARTAGH